jgi:uncharacterized MnhB-related membrane protein
MNDFLPIFLQIFLVVIALAIIFHDNQFTIIILMSVFSLIAATLYMLNQAPDVAIAEVAINAAIIPLIYVIAISRQRELIVLDTLHHGQNLSIDSMQGEIYVFLRQFAKKNRLKINLCCDLTIHEKTLFDDMNIDLIIYQNEDNPSHYILKGKSSSVLLTSLQQAKASYSNIALEVFKEEVHYD